MHISAPRLHVRCSLGDYRTPHELEHPRLRGPLMLHRWVPRGGAQRWSWRLIEIVLLFWIIPLSWSRMFAYTVGKKGSWVQTSRVCCLDTKHLSPGSDQAGIDGQTDRRKDRERPRHTPYLPRETRLHPRQGFVWSWMNMPVCLRSMLTLRWHPPMLSGPIVHILIVTYMDTLILIPLTSSTPIYFETPGSSVPEPWTGPTPP